MKTSIFTKKFISYYIVNVFIMGGLFGGILFDGILTDNPVAVASIIVDSFGSGDYQTIQEAIDNASSGDIIYVWAGSYNERIIVNKSLTIIGNGTINTTLDGGGSGTVVNITSDWVNITGLMVENSGGLSFDSGIKLYQVQYCEIKNNNCSSNENGILLHNSSNNTILDNFCISNSGFGLSAFYESSYNVFENNIAYRNKGGIYLCFSNSCRIKNNVCTDNADGIRLTSSYFSYIENNTCKSNYYIGIWLYSKSNGNIINNNTCTEHTLYEGIRIQSSGKNYIYNNTCKNNWEGVYLDSASRNTVFNNLLNSNGDGISITHGRYNNIINNTCSYNSYGGIYLLTTDSNLIENNSCILNYVEGIRLADSPKNIVRNNNCSEQQGLGYSGQGIRITGNSYSNIIDNNSVLINDDYGIHLERGNDNIIINNTISKNKWYGIHISSYVKNTKIYNNNIIDNYNQVYDAGTNIWNASYPMGGNYWSDYSGHDNFSGPFQNLTGMDGIGDTQYNITGGGGNADKYPLMHPNFWWAEDSPIIILLEPFNDSIITPGTKIRFDIWDPKLNLNNTFYSINGGVNQSFIKNYEIETITWIDGKSYLIKVYADDTQGNRKIKYFNFTVDGSNPIIELISPEDGAVILPETNLFFNISDNNLKSVIYYINGGTGKDFYYPYVLNTSSWSDGQHSVVIRAEDLVNHIVFSSFKFTIDTTPPLISLIAPTNNSIIKAGLKIELNILEPNLANANYSINGTINQTFSEPFNISTTGWLDGDYKIYVHVEDILKHQAIEWYNFTIDATLPKIILNNPDNNSAFSTCQIIEFSITDTHLDEVYYSMNNGLNQTITPPYKINTTGFPDGDYEFRIVAKDKAKNSNVRLFYFSIDSTRPKISLISPKNNSVFNPGINLNFNILDSNLMNIYYSINGGTRILLSSPYIISTSGWSDGQYNIEIYANDTLNHQNIKTFKFIIDSISPKIILTSPEDLAFIYPGSIIDIQINEINLAHANYSINNGINQTFIEPYNIDTFTWPDGEHSVYIYAKDMAGNFASKQYKFTIDSTKPSIELLSPTNNSIIQQGTQIRFVVIEVNIAEVSYAVNNNDYQPFDSFYTILTDHWQDGKYKIRVYVKDKAKNTKVTSFNFNIDSSPPNIILKSPLNNSITCHEQTLDFEIEEPHIASVLYSINENPYQTFYYPYNLSTKGWLDGKYSIKIKAIDLVNYQNIKEFTVTLDFTEPKIICESPKNNSIIRTGQLLDFTITDSNLDTVLYSINNGQNIEFNYPFNINTKSWVDGIYLLKIMAIDKAGNSISFSYNFILDSTKPIIKLITPTNNSKINLGRIIDLEILDTNLLKVEYSIDNNEFFIFEPPYNLSTKNWSLGAHSLNIKATDRAGHSVMNSYLFIIEKIPIPPIIVFVLPLNGSSNVPTITDIVIEFSKEMNKYTVDYSITILPATKGVEFKWNNNSYLKIIFPTKLLEKTPYKIVINKSSEDRSGVHLEKDYILFFTTWADNDQDGKSDSDDDDDDNDHLPDVWELEYGLDPRDNSDAIFDLDNDNLTNLEEHLLGTLPNIIDSDKDGLSDGLEVKIYFTNPLEMDSDNDGVSDSTEITSGSDPNDPEEVPGTAVEKTESDSTDLSISDKFIGAIIIITIFYIILIVLIFLIIQRSKSKEKKETKTDEMVKLKQPVVTRLDSKADVEYVVPDFTIEEIDEDELVNNESSFEIYEGDRR